MRKGAWCIGFIMQICNGGTEQRNIDWSRGRSEDVSREGETEHVT